MNKKQVMEQFKILVNVVDQIPAEVLSVLCSTETQDPHNLAISALKARVMETHNISHKEWDEYFCDYERFN